MQPNNFGGVEKCITLRYELYDAYTEAGFGLNDQDCNILLPTVYEYIWPAATLLSILASNDTTPICSRSSLCPTYFTCVSDVTFGYRCIAPSNFSYDLEFMTWIEQPSCLAGKYGLDSAVVGSTLVCSPCAPACSSLEYEHVSCSTTSNRGCTPCSGCEIGFTATRACNVRQDTVCEDIEPPILSLLGDELKTLEYGDVFIDPGYTASDRGEPVIVAVTSPFIGASVPVGQVSPFKA
jgi:hypothetical protein